MHITYLLVLASTPPATVLRYVIRILYLLINTFVNAMTKHDEFIYEIYEIVRVEKLD